ncbi:MAG TPA: hypothetical protein DEW46_07315 [Verrucomicrobia bacterium]|nr:hypothetical protein [Verrucomicrobiota bacterium]
MYRSLADPKGTSAITCTSCCVGHRLPRTPTPTRTPNFSCSSSIPILVYGNVYRFAVYVYVSGPKKAVAENSSDVSAFPPSQYPSWPSAGGLPIRNRRGSIGSQWPFRTASCCESVLSSCERRQESRQCVAMERRRPGKVGSGGMDIVDYLHPDRIALELEADSKVDAIRQIAGLLEDTPGMTDFDRFLREVYERENLGSTAMGYGIAIPHARSRSIEEIVVAVGRLKRPIAFDGDLGRDVRLVILMGTPHRAVSDYLKLVAGLARRVKFQPVVDCLMTTDEPLAWIDCLKGGGRG